MIETTCIHCGAVFPARDLARWCSRRCWAAAVKAKRPVARCVECGEQFHPHPSQLRRGTGRFCSMACRARQPKNGSVYSSKYSRRNGNLRCDHVVIAERALGHPLPAGAHVHHLNENGRDNRNHNLVICQDAAYHKLLHVRARVVRAGGNPDTQRICCYCHAPKDIGEFYNRHGQRRDSACIECSRTKARERQAKAREEKKGAAA
jgi:hypothetical protein